jgi:two-component system response regulator AtoC
MFLREKGLDAHGAGTGEEGLRLWRKLHPQVVILDIRLPDISGLEILSTMASRDPEAKVIMITAFHDMETTIEAMRQGAYDYIHKPLDIDELDQAVTRALHIADASRKSPRVIWEEEEKDPRQHIVGRTPVMQSIYKTIGLLARNRATVLIEGETGTGKELIARVIHESSNLKDQPFVTVDCTTLVDNLLESELFGHERGAFTGAVETKRGRLEMAGEGTIFFDEVGDLPPLLQAKLLRFLEYREFTRVGGAQVQRSQARIVAATNQRLAELAQRGLFRQDLLYRLKVINLRVPPLRERADDLPELVQFFLARLNRELRARVSRVEEEAMELLAAHPWPGNVRELRNVLTKGMLESRGAVLLTETVRAALACLPDEAPAENGLRSLEQVERAHIVEAMAHTGWNLSNAAKALGVSRPTLRKRLRRFGLQSPDKAEAAD